MHWINVVCLFLLLFSGFRYSTRIPRCTRLIQAGREVRIFTWRGDVINDTLAIWLGTLGLSSANERLSVVVFDIDRERVLDALDDIVGLDPPGPGQLAAAAHNLMEDKWDWTLPLHLLRKAYGSRHFDASGAQQVCAEIMASEV